MNRGIQCLAPFREKNSPIDNFLLVSLYIKEINKTKGNQQVVKNKW